jgi:hypothetical protein
MYPYYSTFLNSLYQLKSNPQQADSAKPSCWRNKKAQPPDAPDDLSPKAAEKNASPDAPDESDAALIRPHDGGLKILKADQEQHLRECSEACNGYER